MGSETILITMSKTSTYDIAGICKNECKKQMIKLLCTKVKLRIVIITLHTLSIMFTRSAN